MFTVIAHQINSEGEESTIKWVTNGTVAQAFTSVGQIITHMQNDTYWAKVTKIELVVTK